MAVIDVLSPGPFTTVQDLGRPGYGPLGVSPAGAADSMALRLANRLVGNVEKAPALEMTLVGSTLGFPQGATVALAGAEFEVSIPFWTPCVIPAGETVRIGPTKSGARCYLAVRGGIDAPQVLGSASTHVLSGLGGRLLKKGDSLPIGERIAGAATRQLPAETLARLRPATGGIRITWGPNVQSFTPVGRGMLLHGAFRVTEEANRMGIRLDGPALETRKGGHMITAGVSLGAIQVPPGGKPIILFVDQQTTGGYPIIANVISADLWKVAQLRPRDEFSFVVVTPEAARAAYLEQESLLRSEILC